MLTIPTRPIKPRVLSVRLIPAPNAALAGNLSGSTSKAVSYGLLSCDFDHALHIALDEATKASPVRVLSVRATYAGVPRANEPFTGEAYGILEGADDEIVREGLKAAVRAIQNDISLQESETTPPVIFFPHVVTSVGEYLAKESGVAQGEAMAYLIAPPVESIVALDAALKAAHVQLVKHLLPPTETNRGGAWLSGSIEECQAAAQAFADAVCKIAAGPIQSLAR